MKKEKTYPIAGNLCGGNIYQTSVFPPSDPGNTNFTQAPPAAPASFQEWFDFYVRRIGLAVEKLNALQFNLFDGQTSQIVTLFTNELNSLAEDMGMGTGTNPAKLQWPLSGNYICDLMLPYPGSSETPAKLIVGFEDEPEYHMVTNCSVQLLEYTMIDSTTRSTSWKSSSSSSLATSSSSS